MLLDQESVALPQHGEGNVPIEVGVVKRIPKGLQAVDARGRTLSFALDADPASLGDNIKPVTKRLLKEPGPAWHRIVDEQVHLLIRCVSDYDELQVVNLHVQNRGGSHSERLSEAVSLCASWQFGKSQCVCDDIREESQVPLHIPPISFPMGRAEIIEFRLRCVR
jgi:hypothetical protein